MLKLRRFLQPYYIFLFLDFCFLAGQASCDLYLPTVTGDMVNNGMMQGNTTYVYNSGVKMLFIALIGTLCAITASFIGSRMAIGIARDLRRAVFVSVEGYSMNNFDKIGTASLVTRSTNDITQIQNLLVMGFRFILYSPIVIIAGFVLAYSKDKGLTVILGVAIPVLIMIMVAFVSKVMPLFKVMQKKVDAVNLTLRESLIGIRVIRAFNKMEYEKKRFTEANTDLTQNAIKINRIMAAMQPIMMVFLNLTLVAIIWLGGWNIAQNTTQFGNLFSFQQYAMTILFSVIMIGIMFIMIPRAQASAVRVGEVLSLKSEITDPEKPVRDWNERGRLEFKDVTFAYEGAEAPILNNISFSAAPGEMTAIIGGTGSGKSTLINLIPRFYDVTAGQVLVDGVDVRDMTQHDLRDKIGFVPQGAVLFSGTVADNIRFGKKDAAGEEVEHAAKVAQAFEFVSKMDDGFESMIAQGGTNVSGGQKQRLSIARAVVRKPEIYIFDDSFSALDFKTDAALRAALKEEVKGYPSTVVFVAQRISTVMDADRIIVLDEGSIAGIGTHRELLASCPVYHEIASSQLSEEELA